MELERAKVVVLGDSGVGKSAFIHLLCHGKSLPNPTYTIGCSLDVKIHQYHGDHDGDKSVFIEFWDVGGCTAHANTRSVFYTGAHGLILVYDCTNQKSQMNLRKWFNEFSQKTPVGSSESLIAPTSGVGRVTTLISNWSDSLTQIRQRSLDKSEDFAKQCVESPDKSIPVLVVGTKFDQLSSRDKKRYNYCHSASKSTGSANIEASLGSGFKTVSYPPFANDSTQRHEPASVCIDLSSSSSTALNYTRGSSDKSIASDLGFPEVVVDSNNASSLAPNCPNALVVEKFLDQVVWTKLSKMIGFGSNSPDLLRAPRYTGDALYASNGS